MPKPAIPKITYIDKVDLLDDARVPAEKKISAADLNEIKAVVNNVIENGVGGSTVRVGGNTFDEAEEMELWMTTSTKEKSLKATKNNIAKLPVVEDADSNIYPRSKSEYIEYHGKVDGAVNTHNAIDTLADQRVKVGDDTYETATPKGILLKVKTQAEMLAGQRGLPVQDKRLLSSGVVHDGAGLDTLINDRILMTPSGMTKNAKGTTEVKNADFNTMKSEGNYYCYDPVNAPLWINGYLEVRALNDDFCLQRFTDAMNGNVYQRIQFNGTWYGWKLIAGEVDLWTGSALSNTVVSFAQEINQFGELLAYINGDLMVGRKLANGWRFAGQGYSTGAKQYTYTCLLEGNTIKYLSIMTLSASGNVYQQNIPITKIVGRP